MVLGRVVQIGLYEEDLSLYKNEGAEVPLLVKCVISNINRTETKSVFYDNTFFRQDTKTLNFMQ